VLEDMAGTIRSFESRGVGWLRPVGAVCARCGLPIVPGTPWDLGHVDGSGKTMYQGPEHRKCNRGARPGRDGGVGQQGAAPWLSPPNENWYRRPWSRDWGGGTPTSPEGRREGRLTTESRGRRDGRIERATAPSPTGAGRHRGPTAKFSQLPRRKTRRWRR
jgi:hypothetical protein